MVIRATKSNENERQYTSASVHTHGKFHFTYGRLEMVAKLPYGSGIWPAFWTLGANIDEFYPAADEKYEMKSWPACGEIDILEMIGGRGSYRDGLGDQQVFSTLHYPDETPSADVSARFLTYINGKLCDDFHSYGVLWDKETISFYVDGFVWKQRDIRSIPSFHQPHFLLVNLAIGGNWVGDPDEQTVFPQEYCIKSLSYYPMTDD